MSEILREEPSDLEAGLRLHDQLRATGFIQDSALVVPDEGISLDEARSLAAMLGFVKRNTSWVLGDLIVYCEKAFGDDMTYSDIAVATGLAYQTVANLASVSRRVPPSRRVSSLPPSMHATVAKLPAREQKQLLTTAAREGWSREAMREHVRALEEPVAAVVPELNGKPDAALVFRAVRSLLQNADVAGENVVVRAGDVARLRSAMGEH